MQKKTIIYFIFCFILAANIGFWLHSKDVRASWVNVPPVPKEETASMGMLGDNQLAYRSIGIMIQNLGDSGGHSTSLKKYNYDMLAKWFFLEDYLDPKSNYIPFLAAYYYGASSDPEKVEPLIEYLTYVGEHPYPGKWRWLAQAVYLARHVQKDADKALVLAQRLAKLEDKTMPAWTKQMPAFILSKQGDKKAAYDIMVSILATSAQDLHPNEVNFMLGYICTKLLSSDEVAGSPLCQE